MAEGQTKDIVVLGAGVIGLTTAIRIQEKGGYRVSIVAETLSTDPKTIRYTSQWAGAHHVSFAWGDPKQLAIDKATFDVLWPLSAPGQPTEGLFLRLPQSEYYVEPLGSPHHLEWMPDYKVLLQSELSLAPGTISGISFQTLTIDTPRYLSYLLSRFLSAGGTVTRGSVQHISQLLENGVAPFRPLSAQSPHPRGSPSGDGKRPDAVVVCAGIGARTLGGVEDTTVYPLRGQTVLLRAPWVRSGRTRSEREGAWTYIIPRRSGDVIVGGTRVADDWHPTPRASTTRDILARVLQLMPELAPPSVRAERAPTVDDLIPIIIEEGCGLRPARKDGIRLETEWFELHAAAAGHGDSGTQDAQKGGEKARVPVVYNYGHGGAGFQASWGSADIAVELLEKALANGPPPNVQ